MNPGKWYGSYFDANGWSGDVTLSNITVNNNQVTGDALVLVSGTDLGYRGTLNGTINGNTISLAISSAGSPNVTVPLSGYFLNATVDWVIPSQAIFGILSPLDVPSAISNESTGGVWALWPVGGQYCDLVHP